MGGGGHRRVVLAKYGPSLHIPGIAGQEGVDVWVCLG